MRPRKGPRTQASNPDPLSKPQDDANFS
jgi:hypothetical protein